MPTFTSAGSETVLKGLCSVTGELATPPRSCHSPWGTDCPCLPLPVSPLSFPWPRNPCQTPRDISLWPVSHPSDSTAGLFPGPAHPGPPSRGPRPAGPRGPVSSLASAGPQGSAQRLGLGLPPTLPAPGEPCDHLPPLREPRVHLYPGSPQVQPGPSHRRALPCALSSPTRPYLRTATDRVTWAGPSGLFLHQGFSALWTRIQQRLWTTFS